MITIMRFGENNVYVQNRLIYMNFGGMGRHRWSTVLIYSVCTYYGMYLFIPKKMEKVHEHDLYLNEILHHFAVNFFSLGWIIKILWKGGLAPISLRSEYSSSNWFHSNSPNSRHLFNRNMYLLHFHSKNNIKMHFPKSWVLK